VCHLSHGSLPNAFLMFFFVIINGKRKMYHERLLNYVILLIKDDVAIVLPECNKFESKNLVKSVMVVED
jgi:hypothetical protein